MARKLNMIFLAAVAIAALIQSSAAQTVHVVGDAMGWVVPPNGDSAYTTWASNKSFAVGDILVFNFASGRHDVAEVTKANFGGCNTASPISLTSSSPANISLNAAGEHYYICTFTGHCSSGQKLAINVTAASSPSPSPSPQASVPSPVPAPASQPESPVAAPSPQPAGVPSPGPELAPSPATAPTPSGPRLPMTYTVGDALGWSVPPNGSNVVYQTWASGKSFMVGDTLVFNYVNGTHNVAEVTKEAYDSCNTTNPVSLDANPPTRITLNTTGEHYFTCTFTRHCSLGQQLTFNVTGSAVALPPSPTSLSPSPTATPPSTTTTPSSPSPTAASSPLIPPPNSGTSLGAKGLFVTFLSIVVAFLY